MNDKLSRRDALASAAALAGGLALSQATRAQVTTTQTASALPASTDGNPNHLPALPPGRPGRDYTPVIVPNGWTLPFNIVDNVKVFHLVVEEVYHEFAPGLRARCWGYNGSVHGPLIECVEGERVRIFVTSNLAAPTTVHWHGLLLPSGMDGVGGLSQKAIQQGETFMYEFTLRQHGTFMYHSHHDEMTQMGMGLTGLFIIHPRNLPREQRPDRDFALLMHEWDIPVGSDRPDPNEMTDFNVLTFNAKAFPGTAPLIIKQNDRVRIRFGNLSAMDHHPIHLHGFRFTITATDGGDVPQSARRPDTSVLVAVGQTRTIEFVADNPGDWAMHCHMTHHVMNQMGHEMPNMIGVEPGELDASVRQLLPMYMTMGQDGMGDMGAMGMAMPPNSIPMVGGQGQYDYITMGGMFTILKVRESLPQGYDVDPGWYNDPPHELASLASAQQIQSNNIDAKSAPRNPAGPLAPSQAATPTQGHSPHDHHGGHDMTPSTMAANFVCPMHPEITSETPGKCPKCGMNLVAGK